MLLSNKTFKKNMLLKFVTLFDWRVWLLSIWLSVNEYSLNDVKYSLYYYTGISDTKTGSATVAQPEKLPGDNVLS